MFKTGLVAARGYAPLVSMPLAELTANGPPLVVPPLSEKPISQISLAARAQPPPLTPGTFGTAPGLRFLPLTYRSGRPADSTTKIVFDVPSRKLLIETSTLAVPEPSVTYAFTLGLLTLAGVRLFRPSSCLFAI